MFSMYQNFSILITCKSSRFAASKLKLEKNAQHANTSCLRLQNRRFCKHFSTPEEMKHSKIVNFRCIENLRFSKVSSAAKTKGFCRHKKIGDFFKILTVFLNFRKSKPTKIVDFCGVKILRILTDFRMPEHKCSAATKIKNL